MMSARRKKQIGALATGSLFAIMFFFGGQHAHASSHTYSMCADFGAHTGSCAGSVMSFDGTGNDFWQDNAPNYAFVAATTYYISITASGTGNGRFTCGNYAPVQTFGPTGEVGLACVSAGGGGFYIDDGGSFVGTVSAICADTDGTSCGEPPPAPSSTGTSTTGYNCIKAASSSDCLIQVVDNPTEDFAFIVLAFVGGFFGMIWLFKGRH